MPTIPAPRLLPLTIFALSGLLGVKSVTLVRAAVNGPDKSAAAATTAAPDASAPEAATPPTPLTPTSPAPTPTKPDNRPATTPPPARTAGAQPASVALPPATPAVAAPEPAANLPSGPPPAPAVGDGERTVLLELRQRREALDTRETAMNAREATLAAAELRLTRRVSELESLQHKLESLEQGRQQREDASWQGLVKLYENMKPRDAATIFNELDMPVLLGVVDRMKDAKAAPVLAAMQPDKARELTTKLAEVRTKRAAVAQNN